MIRPVYLTALVVVVSDQLSKLWALQTLGGAWCCAAGTRPLATAPGVQHRSRLQHV